MVVGDSVLSCLEGGRLGGIEDADDSAPPDYLSRRSLSQLQRERQLQSVGRSLRVFYFAGDNLIWTAHHSVRLSLPGRAPHHSSALPEQRRCPALANPTLVLPMDQHPRILVARPDYFCHHCGIGTGHICWTTCFGNSSRSWTT